jgi:hypothetical protein
VSRFWRQKIPCWTRLEALGRPGGLANRQGIFSPAEQLYVGGNRNGTRGSADVIIIRIIRWEIPNRIDFIFWSDFGKVDPRVGEFLIQNVQSRSAGLYADCCLGGSLGSRRAKELESDSERNSSRMGGIKSILDLLKSTGSLALSKFEAKDTVLARFRAECSCCSKNTKFWRHKQIFPEKLLL